MSHTEGVDLVLINPGAARQSTSRWAARLTAVENPVWAGLMATFVRREVLASRSSMPRPRSLRPPRSPSA